jgi:hypothetical protein
MNDVAAVIHVKQRGQSLGVRQLSLSLWQVSTATQFTNFNSTWCWTVEPAYVTGGRGNNMPPEDVFEVGMMFFFSLLRWHTKNFSMTHKKLRSLTHLEYIFRCGSSFATNTRSSVGNFFLIVMICRFVYEALWILLLAIDNAMGSKFCTNFDVAFWIYGIAACGVFQSPVHTHRHTNTHTLSFSLFHTQKTKKRWRHSVRAQCVSRKFCDTKQR